LSKWKEEYEKPKGELLAQEKQRRERERRGGLLERWRNRERIFFRRPERVERREHSGSPVEVQGSSSSSRFTFLFDEGKPTEDRVTVDAKNEFEASIKARDLFTERHGVRHTTSKLVRGKAKKADEHLEEAEKQLRLYAQETRCGWCQKKSLDIAQMTEELKSITPLAEKFAEQVGSLEADKMKRLHDELTGNVAKQKKD